MKMFKILILLSCLSTEVRSTLEDEYLKPVKNNFEPVSVCINEIFKTSLNFRPTIMLHYGINDTEDEQLFFKEMLRVFSTNNIQQVIFDDLSKMKDVIVPEEADWLMVEYFSNCESLHIFDFDIIYEKIKYIIAVPDYLSIDCTDEILEVVKYVANYDVTFIFKSDDNENLEKHEIVTFIPQIDEFICKKVVRELTNINNCRNITKDISRIFPNKYPTNLKKCMLNIGIRPLYPFAIIQNMSKIKTLDKLHESQLQGLDLEIIKIAGKQFNATLNYRFVKKNEINPLGQYDFIPFIMNGSLDICVGGFYRIYGDAVFYSGVYANQDVIWMYTADRKDKSWQNFVEMIKDSYIFLIFYMCYFCSWYLICKFDYQGVSPTRGWIYAWGALVGANSIPDGRSFKQKIVNLMYLIMCLHLSAYVVVQLYSFYTISEPPERLITFNDVMQSGRPTYLVPSFKNFIFDEKYMTYVSESSDCNSFHDCFEKSFVHKGMTLLLQGVFLKYQAQSAIHDEAKILGATDSVRTVYFEMLIRKSSAYATKFQHIVNRLFESGISDKLYENTIGLTVLERAKIANKNTNTNSYTCHGGCKITLKQLDGAFYVWMIGCGISFCVFIVELAARNRTQNAHRNVDRR